MSRIRAKFVCHSVQDHSDQNQKKTGESVQLSAVYSSDPNSENKAWAEATPSGSLSMHINNPGAFGAFEQGREYFLDFTPAG